MSGSGAFWHGWEGVVRRRCQRALVAQTMQETFKLPLDSPQGALPASYWYQHHCTQCFHPSPSPLRLPKLFRLGRRSAQCTSPPPDSAKWSANRVLFSSSTTHRLQVLYRVSSTSPSRPSVVRKTCNDSGADMCLHHSFVVLYERYMSRSALDHTKHESYWSSWPHLSTTQARSGRHWLNCNISR